MADSAAAPPTPDLPANPPHPTGAPSPAPIEPLSPEVVPPALELLDIETAKLLATVDTLTDADLAEPSLCDGWTRGHVVTHLARNAEGLVRVVIWARTGVRTPQYPSQASRDADIADGAPRSAEVQREDLRRSCDLVRDALAALALPLAVHEIEMSSGPADARELPRRRLTEVVLHHLDLTSGFTLADAHPLAVADLLDLTVGRLERDPAAPAVTLVSDEGDRYVVRGGGPEVRGPAAALLGWLARGLTDGVRADDPLPALP